MKLFSESFWGDVHKRSRGQAIRAEDDVQAMSVDAFFAHLEEKYKDKIYWMDKDHYTEGYDKDIVVDVRRGISIYGNYKNDELQRIVLVFSFKSTLGKTKYVQQRLESDKFETTDIPGGYDRFCVTYKHGVLNNHTYVDLIEFLLDIHINESFWGDVHKRSRGDEIRKEDDINNLNAEEFVDYLENRYEVTVDPDFFRIGVWYLGGASEGIANISIPIEKNDHNETPNLSNRMLMIRKDVQKDEFEIKPNKYIFRLYPNELKKTFGDDFDIDASDFKLTPYSGKITNQVCVDVLDKLLGMVERPILIKKVTESFWGDVHKRSRGDAVRKEDEMSDDDLNALDDFIFGFATRVVWDGVRVSLTNFLKYIDENPEALDCDIDRVKNYVEDNWHKSICDDVEAAIEQEYREKEQDMNESFWGDVHKRSIGDSMRKEDEVLSEDELNQIDQYITDYGNEVVLGWGRGSDACNLDEFINYLKTDRKVTDRILKYVKDNWFGEICDDVEGSIEQAQLEYNQDMYESFWGDVHKRSIGDSMRKEDEVLSDMEINSLNEFTLMYCRRERAHYIQNHIVPPPPSKRKENDYEGLIKYIEDRRDENLFTNVGDYEKIIEYIKKNWDKLDMDTYIKKWICSPDVMKGTKLVECDGVPGGLTPADVGGMGPAYFPGPNGEPGSGDLPSPTGIVYKQVAPFDTFIKMRRPKKNKKKKFRKEDEPCVHSPNAKVYDYVDDFRDYVDRTYNNMDRRK